MKTELAGALLLNKPVGITSFSIIEELRSAFPHKSAPKMGHGGTLDPFATGLVVVLVNRALKLARHFLGSRKIYEGTILFGQTTIPGDPTAPISETSQTLPSSLESMKDIARKLTQQPYLQTPPMHSAKKFQGRPLYELAREGIEIDREPKLCHLFEFEITSYAPPRATFRVECSSGTYIRTLAQDFARLLGSVGMLESLVRTQAGPFVLDRALPLASAVSRLKEEGCRMDELSCWVPFDELLAGFPKLGLSEHEARALVHGRTVALQRLIPRIPWGQQSHAALFDRGQLLGVVRLEGDCLVVENVFPAFESHGRRAGDVRAQGISYS